MSEPRCNGPAIAIVSFGSAYAVCRRHMRWLYEVRIIGKADTGSHAALDADGVWRRVEQTWHRDHLDE